MCFNSLTSKYPISCLCFNITANWFHFNRLCESFLCKRLVNNEAYYGDKDAKKLDLILFLEVVPQKESNKENYHYVSNGVADII